MGVTVSHASLLAQCRALTQACGYLEGKGMWGTSSSCAQGTRELSLLMSDPVLYRTCPLIWCSRCRMLGPLFAVDEWALSSKLMCMLIFWSVKSISHQFINAQLAGSTCNRAEGQCILHFKNRENRVIGTRFSITILYACGLALSCPAYRYTDGMLWS